MIEKALVMRFRRMLGKDVEVSEAAFGSQSTPKFMRIGKPVTAKYEPPQLLPPPPAQPMELPPPIMGAGGVALPPDPMAAPPMMAEPQGLTNQQASAPPMDEFDMYKQNSGGF